MERINQKPTDKQIDAVLNALFTFFDDMDIGNKSKQDRVKSYYRIAFKDIPFILLSELIEKTIINMKFKRDYPLPSHLISALSGDIELRKSYELGLKILFENGKF